MIYWIKSNKDSNKCPLCNTILKSCYIGTFCDKKGCKYVDGIANLTKAEAKKYKNKLLP